ncbi:glycosyltransferase family 2 protein [Bradyrhizobium diazoefficiens]|uniref:glycosyltransferase family 2 protein n=1 Tax=Bradyrhizobium diazoefficiens TaxID=1355477 RepID=UPI00272AF210|nr:glycosyltransferase family 2 protein [Bradyrhizobium diazoefficiens]WLA68030.1 glycosyltransferase family 2 protein [Bradyrhizobium diazoefficiens]
MSATQLPSTECSPGVELSIVVPVYKEAGNIKPFLDRTEAVMARMGVSYEVIFSLDPSPDDTETVILREIERNPAVKLLLFSRRFGQPAATMAGILNCVGEKCVVIDVDLQDQPELIERLYAKMIEGYEVVYAMRSSREGETFIKKVVSYFGYSVINWLSDVQIPRNTGDFRIMSRRVIEELRRLSETHGFLRGMVAFVGFKQAAVLYSRDARLTGTGNYNRLVGSLKIGINGLVGFSSRPLQMMSMAGFVVAAISFLLGFWYVLQKLIGVDLSPGLPTTVLVVSFFSGVQLLALGLVGEYIGRIYDESKRRPMYIIDKKINFAEGLDASRIASDGQFGVVGRG